MTKGSIGYEGRPSLPSHITATLNRLRAAVWALAIILLMAVAGICLCLWKLNHQIELITQMTVYPR